VNPLTLLLVVLAVAEVEAQGPAKAVTKSASVRSGTPASLGSLPAEAACPLFVQFGSILPNHNTRALSRLTLNRVRRAGKGGIEVDGDGDGKRWTQVQQGGEATVAWWFAGRTSKLTFFEQAENWWVCSTATHEGAFAETRVTFLDADADGTWWEPTDYVRWGNGAFMVQGSSPSVDDGSRAGTLRVVARGQVPAILFDELPLAASSTEVVSAQRALNALRNRCGLSPCMPWPEGDALLAKHLAYMQRHDPDGSKGLDPNSEDADWAGHDADAALFAEKSLVLRIPEAPEPTAFFQRVTRGLRERTAVLLAGPGRVAFGSAGNWQACRVVATDVPMVGRYVVFPPPGDASAPVEWDARTAENVVALDSSAPRGLPISIRLDERLLEGPTELAVNEICLFTLPTMQQVPGTKVSIRDIDRLANKEHTCFFVPSSPLQPATDYVVRVSIVSKAAGRGSASGAEADRLRWQFRTAP